MGAEQLLGYSAQEIIRRPLSALCIQDAFLQGKCEREMRVAKDTGLSVFTANCLRKDGATFQGQLILKSLFSVAFAFMIVTSGIATVESQAEGPRAESGGAESGEARQAVISGEVLKMENNSYVLRAPDGHETRIFVTQDTRVKDAFEIGDHIEVQMTKEGRAKFIRRLPK